MSVLYAILVLCWSTLTLHYLQKPKEVKVPNWIVAGFTANLAIVNIIKLLKLV